jgi:hypothetical protein
MRLALGQREAQLGGWLHAAVARGGGAGGAQRQQRGRGS